MSCRKQEKPSFGRGICESILSPLFRFFVVLSFALPAFAMLHGLVEEPFSHSIFDATLENTISSMRAAFRSAPHFTSAQLHGRPDGQTREGDEGEG